MDSSRETVLRLVLAHEGGFVDNPKDPGGPTKKGITQRVYDAYRETKGLKPKSVQFISNAEVNAIYGEQYLDPIRYDDLPPGLGYAVADYAINSGVMRAVKDLQRTLNARGAELIPDGAMGLKTLRAIEARVDETEEMIADLCARRLAFMRSLRTWRTFGKGWTRRVMGDADGAQEGDCGVIDYATAMCHGDTHLAPPKRIGAKPKEVSGRAVEASTAVSRTAGGAGTIAAAAGVAGTTLQDAAAQIQGLGLEGRLGTIANGAFLALTLLGVGLLAYSFFQRMRDKGAV